MRGFAAGLLILAALLLYRALWAAPAAAGVSDIIFSEYIDSSGFDKALELYNGTGGAVDLSGYRIELYSDGNSGAPNAVLDLSGVLGDGGAFVIVHPLATPSLQAAAGSLSYVTQFDGNDALLLRRGGSVIDSFGRFGENPGAEWSSGGVGTRQVTLRRKAAVCSGRTAYANVFDPAAEWERWPVGTLTGLGAHSSECGVALMAGAPVINEFVQNHVGTNNREFIEVFGNANFNYSDFSIVVVNGDWPSQGIISRIYQVGVTNPQGYWRTSFLNQELTNGTNSYLLVQGLTAPPGTDLDINDDGVLDQQPWAALVDDVAVSTGLGNARTYSSSTLLPNFDGTNTVVGGASRIPDASDTNSPNDWRRNHFNGQGLGCTLCGGVAGAHEAVNTPSLRNLPGAGAPPPTSTFTPTPSASATIIIPPIVTITPTPTFILPTPQPPPPSGCVNHVFNGDFESTGHWTFGESPTTARYAGEQRRSGLRSMLLGNLPGPQPDVKSYSSVRQLVSIPAGASMAFLRYSHFSQSQEPAAATVAGGKHDDRQEVILLASNLQTLEILSRVRRNNAGWAEEHLDLTRLIGREFYIYFNVFNNGNNTRTWMYLDDVILGVCYPPATPTPLLPAAAPVVPALAPAITFGPTLTMSPTPTASPTGAALLEPGDKGGAAPAGEAAGALAGETPAALPMGVSPTPTLVAAGATQLTVEPSPGTPSPSGLSGCVELIDDGGFEGPSTSWRIAAQGGVAEYTGDIVFEGSQSMRLSNIGAPGVFTATVEQDVEVPDGYGRVILSFRYFPLLEGTPGPSAVQFANVYFTQTGQIARRLLSVQLNSRQWLHSQHDLTALGGQPLRLVLGVQSADDRGAIGMYVDGVSVLACDPGATITSRGGVGATGDGEAAGGAGDGGPEISGDLMTTPRAPLINAGGGAASPPAGQGGLGLRDLFGNLGGQLGPLAIIVGILVFVALAWLLSGYFVRNGRTLLTLLFILVVVAVIMWLSRGG